MHIKYGVAQDDIEKTAAQQEDEPKICEQCKAPLTGEKHVCPLGKKE